MTNDAQTSRALDGLARMDEVRDQMDYLVPWMADEDRPKFAQDLAKMHDALQAALTELECVRPTQSQLNAESYLRTLRKMYERSATMSRDIEFMKGEINHMVVKIENNQSEENQ